MKNYSKNKCEFIRHQAKKIFTPIRSDWEDLLYWGLPHRAKWILNQSPGERNNNHLVDATHVLAQRSFVAGFLEGNTSASRPWYRIGAKDVERGEDDEAKAWLQHFTERTLTALGTSNFYHAAATFYYDYSAVNTGGQYFEETENGFFVHNLMPGSYFVINDSYGEAVILVREFSLNVKAIVDTYKKFKEDGSPDWSNISGNVKKMYNEGNYSEMIDIVHIVKENEHFDPRNPDDPFNRQWVELTYETGANAKHSSSTSIGYGGDQIEADKGKFLKIHYNKRKPFIVGKSTEGFEYGEKGPTLDSLGLIKSLNKKAISKDIAIEQILNPALQGPASLRKSYVSHAPGTFVPIDSRSAARNQKLESIFQVNPAIGALTMDVEDMRQQVDKFYYADFLLFLSKNPKTRTATEAAAVVEEQQRIIGPNLQSLNNTYNTPVLEWVMDYVLFEDPYLRPPPKALEGQSLKPELISVFAQAQKAFDLPSIDRYVQMVANVAQIDPRILDKPDFDKLADLYEDRLYLPAGLNKPQGKVEAMREQAAQAAQRKAMLEETMPAMAKAAKDASAAQQQQ